MIKFLASYFLAIICLVSFGENFTERYSLWEDAPLGIAITMCEYSTKGIRVKFETDLQPPYVVAVYRPREEGLGRRFPIAEVETEINDVFINGDFTDVTVFVQVMTKDVVDKYTSDEFGHRVLTKKEFDKYKSAIRNAEPYVNTNSSTTFEIQNDNYLDLIDDFTRAGFLKTSDTNIVFTIEGRKAELDYSIVTNIVQDVLYTNISSSVGMDGVVEYVRTNVGVYVTANLSEKSYEKAITNSYAFGGYFCQHIITHALNNDHENFVTNFNYTNPNYRMIPFEYSFSIKNGNNDIGNGYRILMFEDSGVCQAQRAYSSRTNMSESVVIPCGFRALSSHNGFIYTTDWEGRRYFQKVTNRVDHVFGGL